MIYHDRIDVSERTDINKRNELKSCDAFSLLLLRMFATVVMINK